MSDKKHSRDAGRENRGTAQPVRKRVLPLIILSQAFCTSLWFASNGVMPQLLQTFGLQPTALGHLTAAVQGGFICGTLAFAIFGISDRYSPSRVFLLSALAGAACNAASVLEGQSLASLAGLRFLTGFFLAGIYPVGMKIASDYYREGLGQSLGFLVGALVLGTAFPHALSLMGGEYSWKAVVFATSCLAVAGGVLLGFGIPDGPFRKRAAAIEVTAFLKLFKIRGFRTAALGYFGHMWELYAFWAFTPVLCAAYLAENPGNPIDISFWSFSIIGIGALGCVASGYASRWAGARKTARLALGASGLCCLLAPFLVSATPTWLFLGFMLFWGFFVVADSPMFSTLVASHAPPEYRGTGLTIVNSIGFGVTVVSIQVLNSQLTGDSIPPIAFTLLAAGPILGLIGLGRRIPRSPTGNRN